MITPLQIPKGETVVLFNYDWYQVDKDMHQVSEGSYQIDGWMHWFYWDDDWEIYAEKHGNPVNIAISPENNQSIPDLMIDPYDISFSNQNPVENETITIYAIIHNLGKVKATAIVNFYDGDPATDGNENFINSCNIMVPSEGTDTVIVEWDASSKGTHEIYVVISSCQPSEKTEDNNEAYKSIVVGEELQPVLLIALGVSNIAPFEEDTERTIPVTVYCYQQPVCNVHLEILEDCNLTITSMSPNISLEPGEKQDCLVKIKVPKLDENVTAGSKSIVLRAVADNNVVSNAEKLDIVIHKPSSTPGFEFIIAIISVAFVLFWKRHGRIT